MNGDSFSQSIPKSSGRIQGIPQQSSKHGFLDHGQESIGYLPKGRGCDESLRSPMCWKPHTEALRPTYVPQNLPNVRFGATGSAGYRYIGIHFCPSWVWSE